MRHFITIVLLILLPLYAKADNSQLYKQLDAAIEKTCALCRSKREKSERHQAGCQICNQQRGQAQALRATRQWIQSIRV